jgi:hypothetical protein
MPHGNQPQIPPAASIFNELSKGSNFFVNGCIRRHTP